MEIQLFVGIAADFPSRYPLGAYVYFHSRVQSLTLEQAVSHALHARIDRVSFELGKVTYDLALDTSNNGTPDFYDAILIGSVDSIFVATAADLEMWNDKKIVAAIDNGYGQEPFVEQDNVQAQNLIVMAPAK